MTEDQIRHPWFARFYIRFSAAAEERGEAEHRRELLADLSGTVVELGAGNGLNFRHYPSSVREVIAIEPEPTMRAAAERAAADSDVAVKVMPGIADSIPLASGSVDAAVASLVLCSVPDQDLALAELGRVLKPGGELRFYEHVIATEQPKRLFLQALDRSGIWPAVAGGCHPARDTHTAIGRAGFTVTTCRRFMFRPSSTGPAIPFILGTATAPASD
jgi:ubiquinone/menaquinone biosynthesis C-methylase UbiE